MRQDLIELIEAQDDVTNAIVLTHNIDFVFLQMVVLPALRHCGRPTLTVFADAQCAADTYAYQAPVLSALGSRYRVVPIAMEPGFRFHPKALLLSGPTEATLCVGSGNLTFGGWRENAEVWVRFRTDSDTTAPFSAFRSYLQDVMGRVPLAGPVQAEIEEAFDTQTRSWAREMKPSSGLLGRVGKGSTLLEQMATAVGGDGVERLVICSPYFDAEGTALRDLVARTKPAKAEVLVQKKYPGLSRSAAAQLPGEVEIVPMQFTRTRKKGVERESFVHAKFYGVTSATRTLVFAGSANCSQAALTIPGRDGNAELVAVQELTADAFRDLYLAEVPRVDGELELPSAVEEREAPVKPEPVRVLAARHDAGLLRVAYACVPGVRLTCCRGGGMVADFTVEGNGVGSAEFSRSPSRMILEGVLAGTVVRSPETWVDEESELRSTARSRSFAGAVRDNVQTGRWGIGAWKDVLDVFCKHLQYLPPRSTGWGPTGREGRDKKLAEFTADDVFATAYGLPNLGSAVRAGVGDDRTQSLQQLLLRWFGIPDQDDSGADGADNGGEGEEPGGDETVDRPEKPPVPKKPPPKPQPVTEADRRRAKKSVDQMTKAMCTGAFLAQRSPELLAADIKISAVLLRTGLKAGWIDKDDFFEATRSMWASLFFSSPDHQNQGWLERRHREAEDPDAFALSMASAELSAALAAWSTSSSPGPGEPEVASYALARVLAVTRLPWLWRGAETEKIAEELGRILGSTEGALSADDQKRIEESWVLLIRRGEALRLLEASLDSHSPAEIRGRLAKDHVPRGALLWQGTSGYCVALDNCRRSQGETVPVLRLQGTKGKGLFRPEFLVPIRALLDPDVLPITDSFGIAPRDTINDMLDEISGAHRPT